MREGEEWEGDKEREKKREGEGQGEGNTENILWLTRPGWLRLSWPTFELRGFSTSVVGAEVQR